MASRKLLRDLLLRKNPNFRHLLVSQNVNNNVNRIRFIGNNRCTDVRHYSSFTDRIKGELNRNPQFQQTVKGLKDKTEESIKGLKDKAEELKGVTEDLTARTKQTTGQLYEHVDGVWTEAEANAKKVFADVEETISTAKAQVKETLGMAKEESSSSSSGTSESFHSAETNGGKTGSGDERKAKPNDAYGTMFENARSTIQKLKGLKPVDYVKKGYNFVIEELEGKAGKRKHIEYTPPDPAVKIEKSDRTDIMVVSSTQSEWSKKWDLVKDKMRGHPFYKRLQGYSEPVVTKSQEIAEDVRERWETSDHPVVHKIQDLNETVFGESDTALSFKEIRQRDPSFSLPDFVSEVQDIVRPVLNAYYKADEEVLKKYCSPEIIRRCKAEHNVFKNEGLIFENKILHISEVEVKETKLLGDSPVIIVMFQTQQVHCVHNIEGTVMEGGKDTIHTVYYAWAMQQVSPEELGEGAFYPVWRLGEMQQYGVQALI